MNVYLAQRCFMYVYWFIAIPPRFEPAPPITIPAIGSRAKALGGGRVGAEPPETDDFKIINV